MRGVHDRMLASILMPAGYATVLEDGKPIAYGLAVVERGMVGLFDIVTVSEARRRGAGRLLVKSLLTWGSSQGATACLSPGDGTNEAARGCTAASAFRKRTAIITGSGFDRLDSLFRQCPIGHAYWKHVTNAVNAPMNAIPLCF